MDDDFEENIVLEELLNLQDEEVFFDDKGDNDFEGGDIDVLFFSEDENEFEVLVVVMNKRLFFLFVCEG